MCTAISFQTKDHYFGRNLDFTTAFDTAVTIMPRNYSLTLRRVNKLAYFFHATLTSLREYELSPYPEPVLQAKLRTPARMKALQMFTNAFPALKELLYR